MAHVSLIVQDVQIQKLVIMIAKPYKMMVLVIALVVLIAVAFQMGTALHVMVFVESVTMILLV